MRLDPDSHASVHCPSTRQLGEVHWYLMKATVLWEELTTTEEELGGGVKRLHRSAFGNANGVDQLHWWVNQKATDLGALRDRTQASLDAVQALLRDARRLRRDRDSYADFVLGLRELMDSHAEGMTRLHHYVTWLREIDELGPSILFSYRVWGSTRRGDRWLPVKAAAPEAEAPGAIEEYVETALGLRLRDTAIWERIAFNEMCDAAEHAEGRPFEVDPDEVSAKACWTIAAEFETYVTQIPDSLRNILLEIEKCEQQRALVSSDAFWSEFLAKVVAANGVETELWDFKQSLHLWHVRSDEKVVARVSFAEDVAAFANHKGGVLLVGISDQRPRSVVGVGDDRHVENRIKALHDALALHLDCPRSLTTIRAIRHADTGNMCLVIAVKQCADVVGVSDGDGRYTYPVRHGTGLQRRDRNGLGVDRRGPENDNYDFMTELQQFVREN